jgi:hypothetical protein
MLMNKPIMVLDMPKVSKNTGSTEKGSLNAMAKEKLMP